MPLNVAALIDQLKPYRSASRWLVAYSGGVDSLVLLQLAAHTPDHPPLTAVHIHHGLQPDADAWEQHCRRQASALGIDFISRRVAVACGPGDSPEQAARDARYRVFAELLQGGDILLMGHHLDDQVETLLLRMLRGSGDRGLAAMPSRRALGGGQLLRPLLQQSRADIESYAREQSWQWVEDPSNADTAFDRNFLRAEVLPQIARRWPDYRTTLGRVAALSDEAAILNEELADLDCHALSLSPLAPSWPISALRELSPGRLRNLLRFWIRSRQLPLPTAAQMQRVIADVVDARDDAEPLVTWAGVQVRRFRGDLYLMAPLLPFVDPGSQPLLPGAELEVEGVGAIALEPVTGAGIDARLLADKAVALQFRRGGERCRPNGRSGSQTLKKLMQEYAIETWVRDRVPLITVDGALAAVGDYWVCEGFAARAGEAGYRCRWQRHLHGG